jgi:hypothetical protein
VNGVLAGEFQIDAGIEVHVAYRPHRDGRAPVLPRTEEVGDDNVLALEADDFGMRVGAGKVSFRLTA